MRDRHLPTLDKYETNIMGAETKRCVDRLVMSHYALELY